MSSGVGEQPVDELAPSAGAAKPPGRGGGGRAAKRRKDENPDVAISKEMSKILRHSPPPGAMDGSGWIALSVLLKHMKHKASEADIRRVVADSDKKRFVIDDTVAPPRIRAAQGHSVELETPVLDAVTAAAAVPAAVHLTSEDSWAAIQSSGELRRMARSHIHFATAPHHLRRNSWAKVALRLDLTAAMAAGHRFFLSTNDVLLCEGPLPVEFVTRVASIDAVWPPPAAQEEQRGEQSSPPSKGPAEGATAGV